MAPFIFQFSGESPLNWNLFLSINRERRRRRCGGARDSSVWDDYLAALTSSAVS